MWISKSKEWGYFYKRKRRNIKDYILGLVHLEYLFSIVRSMPKNACEVGCGTALYACLLSYFGIDIVALDNSIDVLQIAKETLKKWRAKNVQLICADAKNIPFRNLAFDICFSQGLFEHFEPFVMCLLVKEQLRVACKLMSSVPSIYYPKQDLGDERLRDVKSLMNLIRNCLNGMNLRIKLNYYRLSRDHILIRIL